MRSVIVKPAVNAYLKQPCAAPVTIPERTLADHELTPLWARDRSALRQCEAKRAALADIVK